MKKILSIIILITFLTSNLAYGYDARGVFGRTQRSHLRGEQTANNEAEAAGLASAIAGAAGEAMAKGGGEDKGTKPAPAIVHVFSHETGIHHGRLDYFTNPFCANPAFYEHDIWTPEIMDFWIKNLPVPTGKIHSQSGFSDVEFERFVYNSLIWFFKTLRDMPDQHARQKLAGLFVSILSSQQNLNRRIFLNTMKHTFVRDALGAKRLIGIMDVSVDILDDYYSILPRAPEEYKAAAYRSFMWLLLHELDHVYPEDIVSKSSSKKGVKRHYRAKMIREEAYRMRRVDSAFAHFIPKPQNFDDFMATLQPYYRHLMLIAELRYADLRRRPYSKPAYRLAKPIMTAYGEAPVSVANESDTAIAAAAGVAAPATGGAAKARADGGVDWALKALEIEQQLEEYYPTVEMRYQQNVAEESGIFEPSSLADVAVMLREIKKHYPEKLRYLSIGSGDGADSILAEMMGFDVTAVEQDTELMVIAQSAEEDLVDNPAIDWKEGDFFDLLETEKLDLGDFDVLYYFCYGFGKEDEERLFEALKSRMKPGTILILYRFPNFANIGSEENPLSEFTQIERWEFPESGRASLKSKVFASYALMKPVASEVDSAPAAGQAPAPSQGQAAGGEAKARADGVTRKVLGRPHTQAKFHNLQFSDGYLFMGVPEGQFSGALRKGYFYNSDSENAGTPTFLGNVPREAYSYGQFDIPDTAIVVFRSRIFNGMQQRDHAGIEKVTAGRDKSYSFRYPFIMEGIPFEEVEHVLISDETRKMCEGLLNDRVAGKIVVVSITEEDVKRAIANGRIANVLYDSTLRVLGELGIQESDYAKYIPRHHASASGEASAVGDAFAAIRERLKNTRIAKRLRIIRRNAEIFDKTSIWGLGAHEPVYQLFKQDRQTFLMAVEALHRNLDSYCENTSNKPVKKQHINLVWQKAVPAIAKLSETPLDFQLNMAKFAFLVTMPALTEPEEWTLKELGDKPLTPSQITEDAVLPVLGISKDSGEFRSCLVALREFSSTLKTAINLSRIIIPPTGLLVACYAVPKIYKNAEELRAGLDGLTQFFANLAAHNIEVNASTVAFIRLAVECSDSFEIFAANLKVEEGYLVRSARSGIMSNSKFHEMALHALIYTSRRQDSEALVGSMERLERVYQQVFFESPLDAEPAMTQKELAMSFNSLIEYAKTIPLENFVAFDRMRAEVDVLVGRSAQALLAERIKETARPRSILVIEPDFSARPAIRSFLEGIGFYEPRIYFESTLEDAQERRKRLNPDLVINNLAQQADAGLRAALNLAGQVMIMQLPQDFDQQAAQIRIKEWLRSQV
jgi:hypothetical protein